MSTSVISPLRIAEGFWYLATPYTKFPGGIEAAFVGACCVTAKLLKAGVPAYSPIVQTHPVAVHGGIDPLDHAFWLPADRPMMEAAHGLLVVTMPSWHESYGVAHEIDWFLNQGRPVHYINPQEIE